jgi:hypothetical protein
VRQRRPRRRRGALSVDAFDQLVLADLDDRCRRFQERVSDLRRDRDLGTHASIAYGELADIRKEIAGLQSSPAINDAALNPQHSAMLARLGDRLFVTEAILGPALDDFDIHDRRLTRLTRRIAEELGWPMPAPVVVASSDSGYMTYMRLFLMKVPLMEDEKILAYPDIVHEMGHILSTRYRRQLIGDFPQKLREYFQRESARPDAPPLPNFVTQNWPNWLEEYLCDMVAVYAFGESFALQHRKLTSLMPARSFSHADSHPADESRLRGAAWVLRKMGNDAAADRVTQLWDERMKNTRERKPGSYERTAPDELLEYLAERVVAGARQLGIKGADTPPVPGGVVEAVQQAWAQGTKDPKAFAAWERATLERLWNGVGLAQGAAPAAADPDPAPVSNILPLRPLADTSPPRPQQSNAARGRAPVLERTAAPRQMVLRLPHPPLVATLGEEAGPTTARRVAIGSVATGELHGLAALLLPPVLRLDGVRSRRPALELAL